MRDWPQTIKVARLGKNVEVVPADLARELYGELRRVARKSEYPPARFIPLSAYDALARYEREVRK